MTASNEPADPRGNAPHGASPSPLRKLARWGFAIGVFVASVTLAPLVVCPVDRVMHGSLTPGEWSPLFWLQGGLLSTTILGGVALPFGLLLAAGVAVLFVRRYRDLRRRCPTCSLVATVQDDVCSWCGPLPPRRSAAEDQRRVLFLLLDSMRRVLAPAALFAALTLFFSTGLSWVRLEREEDAFGRWARIAEEAGERKLEVTNVCGSLLTWHRGVGFRAERD